MANARALLWSLIDAFFTTAAAAAAVVWGAVLLVVCRGTARRCE